MDQWRAQSAGAALEKPHNYQPLVSRCTVSAGGGS